MDILARYLTNTPDSSLVTMHGKASDQVVTDSYIGFILCSLVAISNFPPSCLIASPLSSVLKREKKTESHDVCCDHGWGVQPPLWQCHQCRQCCKLCAGAGTRGECDANTGAKTILWLRDKASGWGAEAQLAYHQPSSQLSQWQEGFSFQIDSNPPVQQSGRWRDRQHNIYLQKNNSVSPLSMFSW